MLYNGKEVNKINHLTPIKFCFKRKRHNFWLFKCDCGNEKIIDKHSVTSGHTKSCGCNMVPKEFKHLQNTRLFSIWRGMMNRCYLKSKCNYRYYGGRGIKVCDDWNETWHRGFLRFYDWAIKSGYKDGLTLDRIDVNGDYCPENCRWVTWEVQVENRRDNSIKIEYNGEKRNLKEWCRLFGMNYSTIRNRIKTRGLSFEEALKSNKFLTKNIYCEELNKTYKSVREIANELNISKGSIYICLRNGYKIKGMKFYYI